MNGLLPGPQGHLVMQYPPGLVLLDALPFFIGQALDSLLPAGWQPRIPVARNVGEVPRRVFLAIATILLARNLVVLAGLAVAFSMRRRLGFSSGSAQRPPLPAFSVGL